MMMTSVTRHPARIRTILLELTTHMTRLLRVGQHASKRSSYSRRGGQNSRETVEILISPNLTQIRNILSPSTFRQLRIN